jgi:hypothetical protein
MILVQTHYEITAQTQIHPSLIQVHFPNIFQALNFYQTLFKPTASEARFLSQTLPNSVQTPILGWKTQFKPIPNLIQAQIFLLGHV